MASTPANQAFITVPENSYLSKMPVLRKNGSEPFFGLARPVNIRLDGDEESYTVMAGDYLETISWKWYGVTNFGWAIGWVNGINNPWKDLHSGRILTIPKLDNIKAALGRE
jgi:hypothetical protein